MQGSCVGEDGLDLENGIGFQTGNEVAAPLNDIANEGKVIEASVKYLQSPGVDQAQDVAQEGRIVSQCLGLKENLLWQAQRQVNHRTDFAA